MASSKKIGASIGGILILVLAIVAFALSPFFETNGGSGSGPTIIGRWGNTVISNAPDSPFVEQYNILSRYADDANLISEDPQTRETIGHQMAYIAFRSAVIQVAMEDELKNAGYIIPEFRLNKELINFYLDSDNVYSELQYANTPETEKVQHIKYAKQQILSSRYIEDLFGNGNTNSYGVKTSNKETSFIADMVKKEKSFNFVTFNPSMYPSSEIIKYGKERAELFTLYNFSLLGYYTEEEAKKMLESIKKGEPTFDAAVVLNTPKTLTDEAGKLKSSFRKDINRYFPDNEHLKAVLDLKKDELSPVVKLNNGMFAIVRCDGEPETPDFESESLITEINTYINTNEKGLIEDYLLNLAQKFTEKAKTSGFEKAVANFKDAKLEPKVSNSFSINYGNLNILQPLPDQDFFRTVSENENFFKKAFALKKNEISDPLLIGSDTVVLTLNEEKEADTYTVDSTKKTYQEQTRSWVPYNFAMLLTMNGLRYPIPVSQKTFIENYIFSNPKFIDDFNRILQ